MWDFWLTPNNPPLKKNTIEPPLEPYLQFVWAHALHEAPPVGGSPHHFVQHPYTWLILNPTLILFVRKPDGFIFGLLPQKASYQLDVVHAYKIISLPIPNRCGTSGSHPTILISKKIPLNLPSNHIFNSFGHTPYMKHHLLGAHHIILFNIHTHG